MREKPWTADELIRWLNYENISDDLEYHEEACEKIKDCIREAFAIPPTSEREEELEKIIWEMQKELDKKSVGK